MTSLRAQPALLAAEEPTLPKHVQHEIPNTHHIMLLHGKQTNRYWSQRGPKETLWLPGQRPALSNTGATHVLVPRANKGWRIP